MRDNLLSTMTDYYERLEKIAKAHGGQLLSEYYTRAKDKLQWVCANGHVFYMAPDPIVSKGSWCPFCRKRGAGAIVTLDLCKLIANERGGECLSDNYVDSGTSMQWRCKEGHVWSTCYGNIKNRRSWCSVCAGNKPKCLQDLRSLASGLGGVLISQTVAGVKASYVWQCANGHQWVSTADSVIQGHWCKICRNGGTSRPEREVLDFVKSMYPDALGGQRALRGNRKMSLDVWVPSLRAAIEYDGDYWHSTSQSENRDARKNELCEQEGIRLLRVKHSAYSKHPQDVLLRIRSFLMSLSS